MVIFVYGTLKKGCHNHDYLEGSTLLGEAYTSRAYTLVVRDLPFLIERSGNGCYGELYKVDKDTLRLLDRLEGHPGMYRRTKMVVYDLETQNPVQCEAYLYPDVFSEGIIRDYQIITRY